MPTAVRSVKQEQRELATHLREKHKTWPEVARAFAENYGMNMRVALRAVRDWSQRDAAEQWNRRWPSDPKTFKNFSYWELWPARTGHAPSLEVLARLAELYECSISDLVSDCADFRSHDPIHRETQGLAHVSSVIQPDGETGEVEELVTRVDRTDVHELARTAVSWVSRVGTGLSRRALLLKLSAALSIAAAAPALADETDPNATPHTESVDGDLSGIWHSRYVFTSTGRGMDLTGEHYVALRHVDGRLFGESVPANNGSRLRLDLVINGSVCTGTWSERTSPTGYYRGSVYHGALQLVMDPMGKTMKGKWVGFDRESNVDSNTWDMNWVRDDTGRSAQREYYFKA
ncbi:hypothetical protein [Haloechinothrix sp. LS1_15]|uniref:helix-turn-helix domain-containing protein n=1 Tax=Haloechinothrix sp. LS1_15 TaxID=2652248 RepID=UPI0029446907|nr:hypothetical protein [Haloechinothrix sp. LS1_15]MDV6014017.1 hypothetical protein [Haloechinothrix sp. LS1_15]